MERADAGSSASPRGEGPHALVIQHVAPEGPARIADALRARDVSVEVVRVDLGDPVPADLGDVAALVVMGGPMSARSDDDFPTRNEELELLRRAVDAEVPVLGVCLGAQLLVLAAGGAVHAGHGPEIGWGPVQLLPSAADDPLLAGLPAELDVLHWHGDTFEPPPGSAHLARSEAYEHQAVRVGACAWGLQFHVEVDVPEVERFVDAFGADAEAAPGGAAGIRGGAEAALVVLRPLRDDLLARFAGVVADR